MQPRILVIRNRFIGDTVLAVPFLRNLRRARPDAVIDVLAEPGPGALLRLCPHVDNLLYWRRKHTSAADGCLAGILPAARRLRRNGYEACYLLRRSFDVALLALAAGIPRRIGWRSQGRGWLLTVAAPMPDTHEVRRFLSLLEADGIAVADDHNEGWTDPAADAAVAAQWPQGGRRHVYLFGKSTDRRKDYPAVELARIAAWLAAERGCHLHFCDHPSNRPYYAEVASRLPPEARARVTDWSDRLDLTGTLSLCRRVDAAVGVDTGLVHLVAQFHKPVVALFGSADPRHWHPWDTPHRLLRGPRRADGQHFASDIPAVDVMAAFDSLMSNQASDG